MGRSNLFYISIVLALFVFLVRLFQVQILNDDYAARAERNATTAEKLYAPRGYVYDRNGELLVGNAPVYDLMVSPYLIGNLDTVDFADLIGLEVEDIKERLIDAKRYSHFRSSMFMKMLSKEEFTKINSELRRFSGFHVQKRILRYYPNNGAANVVGFIGEVNTEYIQANPGYSMGDLVGKSGIDKSYEADLKGVNGKRFYTVDHRNRKLGNWQNGAFDELPTPGIDLTSSFDIQLQLYGEKLLRGKRGSIVAIEPETGEILALVTSPNYNPNDLVGRIRSKNYTTLYYDSINKKQITMELVKSMVDKFVKSTTREISIDFIQKVVCDYFDMPLELLKSKTRKREIVQARQLSMYFSKQLTKNSLASIGQQCGNKDHATVLHACRTVNNLRETDKRFRTYVEELQKRLTLS